MLAGLPAARARSGEAGAIPGHAGESMQASLLAGPQGEVMINEIGSFMKRIPLEPFS